MEDGGLLLHSPLRPELDPFPRTPRPPQPPDPRALRAPRAFRDLRDRPERRRQVTTTFIRILPISKTSGA
jgi:hypothetical protein